VPATALDQTHGGARQGTFHLTGAASVAGRSLRLSSFKALQVLRNARGVPTIVALFLHSLSSITQEHGRTIPLIWYAAAGLFRSRAALQTEVGPRALRCQVN
jgi:hypothetical protein